MDLATPAGFRDVLPDEATARERIARAVQDAFAARGYAPIETPTLEIMDVMRAGGRVSASPFKLFDARGDLLAMRPDVTMQVARMCATRLVDEPGPLRLRYMQRVFREADGSMRAEAREMTQIGIECVGASGAEADAEVVGLLAEALSLTGADECMLALATVGVLRALLAAFGASAAWKERVLDAYHRSNFVELDRLVAEGAGDGGAPPVFAEAIRKLPRIRGGREAIGALERRGLGGRLLVDFSVMSSFDYYTGLVFEAYAPGMGTPVGSGGRYDSTIAPRGVARPAAGFAFFLERAMEAASATGRPRASGRPGENAAPREGSFDGAVDPPLRIAEPKGSLNADAVAALAAAGLDVTGLADPGRALIVRNPGVEYVIVRPTDAPAFVASGAADCGICGEDSLLEAEPDVVELVDLGFGACRFVVAEPAGAAADTLEHQRRLGSIRVATKYPRIATRRAGGDREAPRQHRAGSAHGDGRAHRGHHGHRHHPARERPRGGRRGALLHRPLLLEHLRVSHGRAHHAPGRRARAKRAPIVDRTRGKEVRHAPHHPRIWRGVHERPPQAHRRVQRRSALDRHGHRR